jgi:hypothetical protein
VASANARTVSVNPGAASPSSVFYAASMSASGTCFYVRDVAVTGGGLTAGTTYASGAGACSGDGAAALAAGSWINSW